MKLVRFNMSGKRMPPQVPKIYRMRLFAKNTVLAKSCFWYFTKKLNKAKKSGGELLAVSELFDKGPTKVKNYGIWLRYESRTNTHNMYKEFRDVTINGAVSQMYSEMAGRHRAHPNTIQIINTATLMASECKREHMTEMPDSKMKYPVIRKMPLVAKRLRATFTAKRPTTFVR